MYLVIADSHLGACTPERTDAAERVARVTRELGHRIIWAGDTLDVLNNEHAEDIYSGVIQPEDLKLSGNHDWALEMQRDLMVGDTLVVHGDLVDFGYAAARLSRAARTGKGTLVERLIGRTRRWSSEDVYEFYDVLYLLTDGEVSAFEHPRPSFKWRYLLSYLRVARELYRRTPTEFTTELPEHLPGPLPGHGTFGGYFTVDPWTLMERLLVFYPKARSASTVVMGHLHYPIDTEVACSDGRIRRLVALGAMCKGNATVALIHPDGAVAVISEQEWQ